jgi:poly-gamma-glutamate synthesis protein (capsule biosynthesis protein)
VLPRLTLLSALAALAATCGPRPTAGAQSRTSSISFVFAGDVFLHSQNVAAARDESTGIYDFDPVFGLVRPLLEDADFACCWLGGTFSNEPPFTGYPLFRSPASLLPALKRAGFDVCLATNHVMDGGRSGLSERIRLLDSLGLLHPGEFASLEASRRLLVLEKNGIRVALLSYTYGTNGLPVPEPWMVNLIDTVKMAADVRRCDSLGVDFTIVMLHQGEEYRLFPNDGQVRTAEFLARRGVGLVVSSHPHVVQPAGLVEVRTAASDTHRMPVLTYSLGNFYCGQTFAHTRTGLLVRVVLEKDSAGTRVAAAGFTPTSICRSESLPGRYRVLPGARALADPGLPLTAADRRELQAELDAVTTRVENPGIQFRNR